MLLKYFIKPSCVVFALPIVFTALASNAFAKDSIENVVSPTTLHTSHVNVVESNLASSFKPKPTKSTRLDFKMWSDWLERNIFYIGPSTRNKAPSIFSSRVTGSRFVRGHRSPYRYEGNKVPYRTMQTTHEKFLGLYQKDLEELSTEIDITTLSRNDQLAYWFNLHNVTLINQIALNYPIKKPDTITPIEDSDETLHDAKILTVMGRALSLRDIREKIVYEHWNDPIVIYGFHHGNLGGPNIALNAYDRDNLETVLKFNAGDFANSLRGYRDGKLSSIYKETAPFLFPQGDDSIRMHLKGFLRPELFADLSTYDTLQWQKPIRDIADLAGGDVFPTRAGLVLTRSGKTTILPRYFTEYNEALIKNIKTAQKRGWLANGQVIIEDIDDSNDVQKPKEIK